MKLSLSLLSCVFLACCVPAYCQTQLWSGILLPTSGTGTCNPTDTTAPGRCAVDWSTAGIAGGIPSASWTQSGSTILASTYGNGSTDATSAIQAALNSCGIDHYVLLGSGTFLLDEGLTIPSNCALRGAGANLTILNSEITSGDVVTMGSGGPACGTWTTYCAYPTTVSITGGDTAGSTSITVSSASGISVGMYLLIDQLNDGTFVTNYGNEGQCNYCDASQTADGTRAQGQLAEVESVSGNTLTISPALYVTYSNAPEAISFSSNKYSGIENLQIYANDTHTGSNDWSNITMNGCAYCWVSGYEGNYTDGDHVRIYAGFHDEVVNSYFSNAFIHGPGDYDSDIAIGTKSTGCLVQNNIMERLHSSTMLEWGAAGNVIAYNYTLGDFDVSALDTVMVETSTHGGHPQFNLYEGNVGSTLNPDNIWGSSANNTAFRNWLMGTTRTCDPTTGRGTVICAGSSGQPQFKNAVDVAINYLDFDWNLVGDVLGSTAQSSSLGLPTVAMVTAVCGPSPCGANSRPWGSETYGYAFGYAGSVDSGGSSGDSLIPYTTAFMHGEYSNITSATIWASGVTHTLPASFYLGAKPSWWPVALPWPAIGPDVTGGSGPGGYAYSPGNAAQYCYDKIMGGTDGTGSPLSFNAEECYGSPAAVSPPSNLSAAAR